MKKLGERIWTSLPQTCTFPATKNPEPSRTGQNVYPGFIALSTDFFLHIGMVSTFENCTPTLTRLSEVFGLDLLRSGSLFDTIQAYGKPKEGRWSAKESV